MGAGGGDGSTRGRGSVSEIGGQRLSGFMEVLWVVRKPSGSEGEVNLMEMMKSVKIFDFMHLQ